MAFAAASNPIVASLAGGRDFAAADLGAFYSALTVPGTGQIGSASITTFAETTPLLVVFNAGLLNIYPVHLQMILATADTGSSAAIFLTNTLDVGNRVTSGGAALTKVNLSGNSALTSSAVVTFGAITAAAATGARRIVSHSQIRSMAAGVIHDTISVNWGGSDQSLVSTQINNTTTHSDTVVNCAPLCIAPGTSMVLVRWGSSASGAPTYEVNFSYIEK